SSAYDRPLRLLPMGACAECFLRAAWDPQAAAGKLKPFAREAKIGLDPALERFESRTLAIAESGVDVAAVHFSTAFGRGLDYYTEFVFELYGPRTQASEPLVARGRYDGLLSQLGSPQPI